MKKRILALLIIAFSLSACQPTPEQEIVVQKDADRLLEQVQNQDYGTQFQQLEIPATYTYTASGAEGRLEIMADATVSIPSAQHFPTVRVSSVGFTQEMMYGVVAYLFPDQKPMIRNAESIFTKDEIEEQILVLKQQLAEKSYDTTEFSDADIQARILQLEADYQLAPEKKQDVEAVISDGTMIRGEKNGEAFYILDAFTDKANITVFSATSEHCDQDSTFRYSTGKAYAYGLVDAKPLDKAAPTDWGDLTLPYEDAVKLCSDFFDAGQIYDISLAEAYIITDRQTGNTDGIISSAQNYAYYFIYTRTVNDIPVFTDEKAGLSSGDDFALPWAYERITIIVDNDGIQKIEWISPTQTGKTVTADTGLLSFSDVTAAFEKMILTTYEPRAQLGTDGVMEDIEIAIEIDEIQLSFMRIREQNATGRTGLYIPTWVFYGHVTDKRT